jgi:ribosome-associated protein
MRLDSGMAPAQELDIYVKAVLERKAEDILVLDMRKLTSVADAFLICSGRSNRQVTAIADSVQRTLKKQGIRPLSVEGKKDGHWVLMDYGHVVVHIFYETIREFYDLEGLWRDAERVITPSMKKIKKGTQG